MFVISKSFSIKSFHHQVGGHEQVLTECNAFRVFTNRRKKQTRDKQANKQRNKQRQQQQQQPSNLRYF